MRSSAKAVASSISAYWHIYVAIWLVSPVGLMTRANAYDTGRWTTREQRRHPSGLLDDYFRNATKRASGSVLPQPKVMIYYDEHDYLEIEPNQFKLNSVGIVADCVIIDRASKRYSSEFMFTDVRAEAKDDPEFGRLRRLGRLTGVDLTADAYFNCEKMPHSNMDESYTLVVQQDEASDQALEPTYQAKITAKSSWGLLRGLETLSQLIFETKPSGLLFGIKLVRIQDEPRFKHRGFMLDTARHYISVDKILEVIDAMATDKLNVFHWHMVDDQSFPYESSTYPQLSKLNSFRPSLVYTPKDVQLVISYAALRGIRVMPELDTPGHTYALRHILGLLTDCFDPKTGEPNGDFGPVDPTRQSNYKSIDRLLQEFTEVFPDQYFHAGGDEVEFDCWQSNKRINNSMRANNMSGNYEKLTNYYVEKLHELVKAKQRMMVVWQEVFDLGANLPSDDVIVHVWKDINNKRGYMKELSKVVRSGYKALLSSCWYLNYIDYGQDWKKFYQCDPREQPWIRPADQHLVLGGEICMWTEYVDETNVVSRTWPRASAAAERLWSPSGSNNIHEFLPRLEQHRCHLTRRGIQAEPVNGPGYC